MCGWLVAIILSISVDARWLVELILSIAMSDPALCWVDRVDPDQAICTLRPAAVSPRNSRCFITGLQILSERGMKNGEWPHRLHGSAPGFSTEFPKVALDEHGMNTMNMMILVEPGLSISIFPQTSPLGQEKKNYDG